MNQIQQQTLDRAITMLKALNCAFAIIDPDDGRHGALQIVEPRQQIKRREMKFPMGTLSAHFKPHLQDLIVGQVGIVPCKPFTAQELMGSLTAYCSKNWGNGSYTCCHNATNDSIEVLRLS